MKKHNTKWGGLVFCLAEIVLGILLLIDPIGFTSMIITVIGAILALCGIFNIIKYFAVPAPQAAMEQLLSKGILFLGAGAFAVFGKSVIIGALPLITIVYGVIMLIAGVNKIQFIADSIRRKDRRWYFGIVSAAISLALGAIVLINPFGTLDILWIFTGIALIVDAVLDAVSIIIVTDKAKKAKADPAEPIEGEAVETETAESTETDGE